MDINKGILIAVEGIDGSGKSTLAKNLAQALEPLPILLTKEPGATALGSQLRTILQKKEFAMCSIAEYLIYTADRANHFEYVVLPALEKNMIVISDRMADSSLIYQGYARNLDRSIITTVNHWAMHNRTPDLTLYLRITTEQARQRMIDRPIPLWAIEKEGVDFHEKVFNGFETLYANRPDVITLDGTQETSDLTKHAKEAVLSWIQANNR